MVVKILGSGCPKCRQLEANVRQALFELNLTADIVKVTDINSIIDYGVARPPALVVDEQVKSMGKVLTPEEAKAYLV